MGAGTCTARPATDAASIIADPTADEQSLADSTHFLAFAITGTEALSGPSHGGDGATLQLVSLLSYGATSKEIRTVVAEVCKAASLRTMNLVRGALSRRLE